MGLAHSCDVKIVTKRGRKKECGKPYANPVFTTAMTAVTKKNPQPHWECPKHSGTYKPVSPITGSPIEIVTKSYRAEGGKLIPQRRVKREASEHIN